MRFAYADPPYIGQAKRHYSHDPLCAEVDHELLINELEEYDGWALSFSASRISMQTVIPLAPLGTRVAAWVKPFASFKPGVDPAYTWEPVLFRTCRVASVNHPTTRDHHIANIAMQKGLAGAKPKTFCFWIIALLGMKPQDDLVDMFPGTNIMSICWEEWKTLHSSKPYSTLPLLQEV